jgi:hypothetical protein
MNQYRGLCWVVLAGLLLLVSACGPATTAVDVGEAVLTAAPTAKPSAMATNIPTSLPPTQVPATLTATNPPSTEPPPASTSTPSPSPLTMGQGNADVLHVRAIQAADGSWTFQVTVDHPDTGWEDYADGWDVVTPDGTVLKPDPGSPFTRLLLHPHENEQPFTRSQSRIVIPEGVTEVTVRAHDLADGFGGREVLVDLTVSVGDGFEVER